ncbi:MAG: LPS-assembly protein LptD, partial [Rhodospirillaceae bacterium]|nr:LPS-assembly protein LptD [Rhodospirillaceae bacterium]
MTPKHLIAWGWVVTALALGTALPARAQVAPESQTVVEATEMNYDEGSDTLKALGRVEISRDGRVLLADTVTYNRTTDIAVATGNVSLLDKNGTVMFFDRIEIKGDLKEGFAEQVRVLLADKSRLSSRDFRRSEGRINELSDAVYSACDLCEGREPVWQIKAGRVRYDEQEEMVYYRNARVEMFGVPVFYTPYLAHPDPTAGRKS